MAIHENLTKIPKQQLKEIGWRNAVEIVKVARRDGEQFDCAPWVHPAKDLNREEFEREAQRNLPRGFTLGQFLSHLLEQSCINLQAVF
jgi:hypothetical protein